MEYATSAEAPAAPLQLRLPLDSAHGPTVTKASTSLASPNGALVTSSSRPTDFTMSFFSNQVPAGPAGTYQPTEHHPERFCARRECLLLDMSDTYLVYVPDSQDASCWRWPHLCTIFCLYHPRPSLSEPSTSLALSEPGEAERKIVPIVSLIGDSVGCDITPA
ncbi:hypothetical protein SCP_0500080 [Sparassis crispa]|uniref:Uncharacterized protein n=1 Tax=Sparassis crispa TaxID=139825 RepID=A0A401GLC3_9APHY|nr:hypothetical protein SCP_0500080 [Sparassis crispa]GBE82965.1 hypothetical protein SCP_0500080 [Sparassis crispa]